MYNVQLYMDIGRRQGNSRHQCLYKMTHVQNNYFLNSCILRFDRFYI